MSDSLENLMILQDLEFLKKIVYLYPEIKALIGKSPMATPSGPKILSSKSLSYQIFNEAEIDPTAIEIDRTFLSLLLFKAAYNNDKSKFPKLNDDNFNSLTQFVRNIAVTNEDIEFIVYSLACNDLGKTQKYIDVYKAKFQPDSLDHDQIYAYLVNNEEEIFPGLQSFSQQYKTLYKEGLSANFNLGQFVQGENFPANLKDIQKLSSKARDLRLIAEFFDIIGATGHIDSSKSLILNNNNVNFFINSIEELTNEPKEYAYQRNIAAFLKNTGIVADFSNPEWFLHDQETYALGRLLALSRAYYPNQADAIKNAIRSLKIEDKNLIISELNKTGYDQQAYLVYYLPALIQSFIKSADNDFYEGVRRALKSLAKIYKEAHQNSDQSEQIVTIDVSDIARMAEKNPCLAGFSECFNEDKIAFIGGGGGSDVVQASILSILSGKQAFAISIRASQTTSPGPDNKVNQARVVEGYEKLVTDGVYKISPETTGSGRFLEALPAKQVTIYLVIDAKDGKLTDQIQAAIDDFGGVDRAVMVDTGGDCLFQDATVYDIAKASPDQDLASAKAISGLSCKASTMIVAPGIDAPENFHQVLEKAEAVKVEFSSQEKEIILKMYKDYELDGSNPKLYGKTPFAWQAALQGKEGLVCLPLPQSLINDPLNPWEPCVNITEEMAGAYYIPDINKHIEAISYNYTDPVLEISIAGSSE